MILKSEDTNRQRPSAGNRDERQSRSECRRTLRHVRIVRDESLSGQGRGAEADLRPRLLGRADPACAERRGKEFGHQHCNVGTAPRRQTIGHICPCLWRWCSPKVTRSDVCCAAQPPRPRHHDPGSTAYEYHRHNERPARWFSIRFLKEVGCWGLASPSFSRTSSLSREKRVSPFAAFFHQHTHLRM